NGPVTSSTTYGFRNDVLLKLLNIKAREDNPTFNDATINAMIPFLMQQLTMQMKEGELTMYKSLWDLYYKLEVPSAAATQQYATTYNTLQPGMMVGQMPLQQQQQQPMMTNAMGAGPNMHYQLNANQASMPQQEPGMSGMHKFGPVGVSGIIPGPAVGGGGGGTVPIEERRGPVTIDPNVVELD
uniref:Uncharacterized protein n=1 Tax=Anopheles maculatus TaxID=74869 RepID=A0A182TA38_9DIPT